MWVDLALLIVVGMGCAVIGYLFSYPDLRDMRAENARLNQQLKIVNAVHGKLRANELEQQGWPDEFEWSEVERWKR